MSSKWSSWGLKWSTLVCDVTVHLPIGTTSLMLILFIIMMFVAGRYVGVRGKYIFLALCLSSGVVGTSRLVGG
jgi:hypothetical protein